MKSASLTASGSGQQREGKAISDDESGIPVEDKPETDNEERTEPPGVSSTNIRNKLQCLAQINRIRNHFLGRRIKVGRYTRA